jgi:glycosyltransferase 2 family protein
MLRNSRRYLLLVLFLVAIAFLLYKFRNSAAFQGFHWDELVRSIRAARPELLLLSLVGIYACYALRAARWVRFCRWRGNARFVGVYAATLEGFACNVLLGRVAEPIRPVLIARKESLSIPGMFGVYFLERVFDMAATIVIAILALLSFERAGTIGAGGDLVMKAARSAGTVLVAGLAAVVVFLIYFRSRGGAWLEKRLQRESWAAGWRKKAAELLQGFSDGLQGVRTWADLAVLSGYTAVHWALVALIYEWVAHAFGGRLARLTFSEAMLVLAFTMVGSAAQLPVAGGGPQVASFLVLTVVFGVENGAATVAALVLWLISFVGVCIVGLPLLLREGWSLGELKRMAQAQKEAEEAHLMAEAGHSRRPEKKTP